MKSTIVKNLFDTGKLAKAFAKSLTGGEVILLKGDLGAGKTTFTQMMFKALGVKEAVVSPTFTILREYSNDKFNLYHFDMYRIEDVNEAQEFGMEEYFNKPNDIVVIEWFENIEQILPSKTIKIEILKIDENSREFIIY